MLKIKDLILNQFSQTTLRVRKNPGSIILAGSFTFFLSMVTNPLLGNSQPIESLSPNLLLVERDVDLSQMSSSTLSTTLSENESLEWGIKTQEEGDDYKYYLSSVSYKKEGNIIWTIPLPERLTNRVIGYNKRTLPPRYFLFSYFLMGTILEDDAIFIADRSGVLVLDREMGKILVDKPAESSPDYFYVDGGSATIITPTQRCEMKTQGGKFFHPCGGYIVYFNGENLWVWDKSIQLVEQTNYSHKEHDIETDHPRNKKIRIDLRTVTVEVRGFIDR